MNDEGRNWKPAHRPSEWADGPIEPVPVEDMEAKD